MAEDDIDFPPGDDPTSGISVTLRARRFGLLAQRRIERDNLDELIADFAEMHGPTDPEAVAAKRARLTGGVSNAGAA